jgi:DNA-binding MurR/RpiR family transcriptional regulator
MRTPTIFDRIRALEHLTPSETKIAQYLDKAYPLLALETVTSISQRARVGRATVVRFISRLGYSSFAEFQQSLRKELLLKLEAAASLRQNQAGQPKDSIDQFRLHCNLIARNLDEACRRIDEHTLHKCAASIAECSGSIYIFGQSGGSAVQEPSEPKVETIGNDLK